MKKKKHEFKLEDLPLINPVQQKIYFFISNGLDTYEIAFLIGQRHVKIRQIANGKYIPYGAEREKFCKLLDYLFTRLKNIVAPPNKDNSYEEDHKPSASNQYDLLAHPFLIARLHNEEIIACQIRDFIFGIGNAQAIVRLQEEFAKVIITISGDIKSIL